MYKILLVDDHAIFRKKIRCLSCWKDYPDFEIVHEASNGVDALNYLLQNNVHMVITDIKMPIMDGIELLREITTHKLCPCVILLSEYTEFEYARQGLVLGALDYIVKPVTNTLLNDVLLRVKDTLSNLMPENDEIYTSQRLLNNSLMTQDDQIDCHLQKLLSTILTSSSDLEVIKRLLSDSLSEMTLTLTSKYQWLVHILPNIESLQDKLKHAPSMQEASQIFSTYCENIATYLRKYTPPDIGEVTKKAYTFILEHPFDKISLTDVASYCYVNSSYLSHVFKQEMNLSLVDYINHYKMDISKQLMADDTLNVSDIASMLGYDSKYFSRIFKDYFDVSPSTFKKGL